MEQGLGSKFPITSSGRIGGAGWAPYAFELYLLAGFVRVRPGTVNAIDVVGTGADIDPVNGLKIWIHVTADEGGVATAASIGSGAEYPEDDEENGYQPLGTLAIVGEAIVLPPYIVRGGLRHQMCGGIHLFGGLG